MTLTHPYTVKLMKQLYIIYFRLQKLTASVARAQSQLLASRRGARTIIVNEPRLFDPFLCYLMVFGIRR